MSGEGAPRLLARDKDQLNDVAAAIREGQRQVVFFVCDAPLRPVALEYLREQTKQSIPEPVALVEPDQTLQALTEIEGLGPTEVRSFLIVHTAPDIVRTLNWHREKLRRGGTVLLWIEGVEGLRVLRQLGPDAYSFRDTMVMIQGEMPVVVAPAKEESVDVQLARLRYSAAETPIERAVAAGILVGVLQSRGAESEARQTLEQVWAEVTQEVDAGENARLARALLCRRMGQVSGHGANSFRWHHRGLAELADLQSADAQIARIGLLADMPSPFVVDHRSAIRALADAQKIWPTFSEAVSGNAVFALMSAARSWTQFGDMKRARALFREALTHPLTGNDSRSAILVFAAHMDFEAGRLDRALATFHSASVMLEQVGFDNSASAKGIASCYRNMGEYAAARRICDNIFTHAKTSVSFKLGAKSDLAFIALHFGVVSQAISDVRTILHEALTSQNDAHILVASDNYITSLILAHKAQQANDTDITDAFAELDIAESVACAIAGDDPPWYSILFPALRAELLELRPETTEQAITLVSTALDRARSVFEDAVPKLARQLVHHLLQAGHLDRALAMLPAVIDEVAAVRHLRELARLRAYHVVALIRTGAPIVDIDASMHALRETFSEMDAPRIAADTLLELAELLPASSKHVDAYTLADEASSLYAEMPYPFQEARALEVMGDVLAERGNADEALRCYRSSRGICERFGFGLRMPLLDKKIAVNAASPVKP